MMRRTVDLLVTLCCLISFSFILLNGDFPGYEWLPLLPLIYMIAFLTVLSRSVFRQFRIFNLVFTSITFIRYTVLPFFIVYAGYYGGRSPNPPSSDSYHTAILLMVYELVLATAFILYLDRKHGGIKTRASNRSPQLNSDEALQLSTQPAGQPQLAHYDRYFGYGLFAIFCLLLVFMNPMTLQYIHFISPNSDPVNNEQSLLLTLSVYSVLILKQIVFICLLWGCYQKYKLTSRKGYILLSMLLLFLNISIYSGTNRSDIVVCTLASLVIFQRIYPKYFKTVVLSVVGVLILVVTAVSSYRDMASISKGNSQLIDFTDTLQVYLGGPYNVAMAIETKLAFPEASSAGVLLFDIFRPMIGVNLLVKDLPLDYSNLFYNARYFYSDKVSQILPMVGQGNLFFGGLLAPLFTLFFIWLAYYMQSKINKINQVALYYFVSLAIARLGFMMGQNTMNMINDISYNLFLFLIIYMINSKVLLKKKTVDREEMT